MPFLLFTRYKCLHPPMGCTYHTLYFIYLTIKLASIENLINFAEKHSDLALHGIYIIKYPIASGGGCAPQTPCFRDTILGLAPPLSKS